MSCFKIPDGVLHKIRSAIIRFWWGQKEEEKRIHWLRWEQLCRPKDEGGLGLRDLGAFNKALFARQGWRLLLNSDSLLARTLPKDDFSIGYGGV